MALKVLKTTDASCCGLIWCFEDASNRNLCSRHAITPSLNNYVNMHGRLFCLKMSVEEVWSGLKWFEVVWSGLKWFEVVWSGLNNTMDNICKNKKSIGNGSTSLRFGWGRVHSEREDMPRGPRDGPEAWNGQMDIVVLIFDSYNIEVFSTKRTTRWTK
jgi:hypothetical protein